MKPDIAGFRDAQVKMRAEFGEDVPFFTPQEEVWPDGTPLDPETDRPYDPMVTPASSGMSSAVVRCSVVSRPVPGGANVAGAVEAATAMGDRLTADMVLIMNVEDYSTVKDAKTCLVKGLNYSIQRFRPDGMGDGIDRYLCFLESS